VVFFFDTNVLGWGLSSLNYTDAHVLSTSIWFSYMPYPEDILRSKVYMSVSASSVSMRGPEASEVLEYMETESWLKRIASLSS
jgi:hypothetical protein